MASQTTHFSKRNLTRSSFVSSPLHAQCKIVSFLLLRTLKSEMCTSTTPNYNFVPGWLKLQLKYVYVDKSCSLKWHWTLKITSAALLHLHHQQSSKAHEQDLDNFPNLLWLFHKEKCIHGLLLLWKKLSLYLKKCAEQHFPKTCTVSHSSRDECTYCVVVKTDKLLDTERKVESLVSIKGAVSCKIAR